MKKTAILTALIALSITVNAQQAKLPAKLKIDLTDKQVLRIDSAINAAATWTDSKGATNWFTKSFQPLYEQIRSQMILDTVKVKTAPKKP